MDNVEAKASQEFAGAFVARENMRIDLARLVELAA